MPKQLSLFDIVGICSTAVSEREQSPTVKLTHSLKDALRSLAAQLGLNICSVAECALHLGIEELLKTIEKDGTGAAVKLAHFHCRACGKSKRPLPISREYSQSDQFLSIAMQIFKFGRM